MVLPSAFPANCFDAIPITFPISAAVLAPIAVYARRRNRSDLPLGTDRTRRLYPPAALLCLWSLVGLNTSLNLMGARADAVTFFLMIATGLLLFVLTPDPDVSSARDDES